MKLNGKKVRYSPSEIRAFGLLGKRPKTTLELTDAMYVNGNRPYNDRIVVLGVLKKLIDKVQANKEAFIVRCTERRGPHPVSFWIESK